MSSEADGNGRQPTSSGVWVNLRVSGVAGEPGVAAPDLSQSPSLRVEQWESHHTPSRSVAWSCIGGDTSVWSPDATDLAQSKLAEIASATSERMRGTPTPMHVTETRADGRERTLTADDADAHATARTLLAFTEGRAHGCFVTCVGDGCGEVVANAALVGEVRAPPSPGVVLGGIGWMVHHPQRTEMLAGVLLLGAAALAIVTRPRPRT